VKLSSSHTIARVLSVLVLLLCCPPGIFDQTAPLPVVTIQSAPERPIVEVRDANQFLNFDLIVHNLSKLRLRVSEIPLG
jgi:hypothetical protein